MTVPSVEAMLLALAFLAPGYVVDKVRSWFLVRRQRDGAWAWLHFLTLSGLNLALLSPFVQYLLTSGTSYSPLYKIGGWVLVLFVVPAFIGLALGILARSRWWPNLLRKCGIRITSPLPGACDHAFLATRDAHWVIARLKGGVIVRGLFGENSMAGSQAGQRDLFVEKVYEEDAGGSWQELRNHDLRGSATICWRPSSSFRCARRARMSNKREGSWVIKPAASASDRSLACGWIDKGYQPSNTPVSNPKLPRAATAVQVPAPKVQNKS